MPAKYLEDCGGIKPLFRPEKTDGQKKARANTKEKEHEGGRIHAENFDVPAAGALCGDVQADV